MKSAAATIESDAMSKDQRSRERSSKAVLVDGHVHIYPHVPLPNVFRAIERNVGREGLASCVLMLAEPRGVEGFVRLLRLDERAHRPDAQQGWRLHSQSDDQVEVRHGNGLRAVFLRGQQLVTEEGLEVLAAGLRGSVAHGLGLRRTIEEVRLRGGWSTIAWGVGKWLGRRGRLVAEAVRDEAGSGDVMLGDNGGRPWCWSSVPQFSLAVDRGMPIVPGSDPLPVRGDEARIASYGVIVQLPADEKLPVGVGVRNALAGCAVLLPHGKRVGAGRAAYNQLRLQAAGRLAKAVAVHE